MRYIQVVKRAGVKGMIYYRSVLVAIADSPSTVDRLDQMLGSYGPHPNGEPYIKNFDPDVSPSGMLVRTGTYNVKSRVVDDDGEIYAGRPVHSANGMLLTFS